MSDCLSCLKSLDMCAFFFQHYARCCLGKLHKRAFYANSRLVKRLVKLVYLVPRHFSPCANRKIDGNLGLIDSSKKEPLESSLRHTVEQSLKITKKVPFSLKHFFTLCHFVLFLTVSFSIFYIPSFIKYRSKSLVLYYSDS